MSLLGLLLLTLGAWVIAHREEQTRICELQRVQANAMVVQLHARMKGMEEVLRGAAGYLGRGSLPMRREWQAYVAELHLAATYPGIQGISFVEWIPRAELAAHIQRIRKEGLAEYQIIPGGPLPPDPEGCSSIIYLEPMDATNGAAIGRDMLRDATRREAMLRARDTGLLVLSGPVKLYQESGVQMGTVLYAPVYRLDFPTDTVAQRRQAFRGWASYPFRMGDLVRAALARDLVTAEVELFDGREANPANLLFDSVPGTTTHLESLSRVQSFEVAGRFWTVRVIPTPAFFAAVGHQRHWEILLGGLVISLLLYATLSSILGAEVRAQLLADQRGEALFATESRFRALFEKAPIGMAIVDSATGAFVSVNPCLGRILGYSPAELLTRNFTDVTHPEHLERDVESLRELASEVIAEVRQEKRYLHCDGHEVWGRLLLAALPTEPGQGRRHLALVEDITERKQAASAVAKASAFVHAVLDSIPANIAVLDHQGIITHINQGWKEFARANGGLTGGNGLGKGASYLEAIPSSADRDLGEIRTAIQEVIAGTRPLYIHDYPCDGPEQPRWFQMLAAPVQGHAGCLVAHFDITQLKGAEQQIRTSETRLRNIGDQLPDSFVYQYAVRPGEAPRFLYVSAGIERLCGVKIEDALRDSSLLLGQIDPDLLPAYLVAEAVSSKRFSPFVMDLRIKRTDGVWRWFRVRSSPRRQADDTVIWEGLYTDITEQMKAQLELAESESRFRHLADTAPVFIWMATPDKLCFWFNQVWLDWTGRSLEQELGYGWSEGVHPEDLEYCLDTYRRQFDGHQPFESEYRLRHHSGEYRWVLDRGMPRFAADGTFLGYMGACVDIHDKKETETRIKRILREQELILETANVGISLIVARKQIWVNQTMQAIFGYTVDEMVGQTTRMLYPSQAAYEQLGEDAYAELAKDGSYETTQELVRKDGRHILVHYNGRAVDAADLSKGALWIINDVTAQERAADALRRSEESFRQVFECSPSGMSLTRIEDGLILQVNAAWCALFGWNREDALGRSLLDLGIFLDPEDRFRMQKAILAKDHMSDWPLHARRQDGTAMHLRLGLTEVEVAGERCFLTVLLDHTALYEAEQELIQANHSLEDRVTFELEQRLAQERILVHQSRLAAMGEMVGNIAHQWRQPLNALSMVLANLQDAKRFGTTDEAFAATLGQGNALVQKMSTTITDFMDFFRPAKTKVRFSLGEQAREAVKLVIPSLQHHQVSVEVVEIEPVWAQGHPNEFSQVLLNLIANAREAIHHSGHSAGCIRIEISRAGQRALMRVSDNGGGIQVTPHERIFEPYFTDKESGTGLGLYMSRMILEQGMEGTIEARNISGGAEFTITLPLAERSHERE